MSKSRIIFLTVSVLLGLIITKPAISRPNDSIIVNGAILVRTEHTKKNQSLIDLTNLVATRIVYQYANLARSIALTSAPDPLLSKLEEVQDRSIIQYANLIRAVPLKVSPATLSSLLDEVPDRLLFQYANENRRINLEYPFDLIDDNTPPEASKPDVKNIGDTTVEISWTTNEFADSVVKYGAGSNKYPFTAADPLFAKDHVVKLRNLDAGTRYYYRTESKDLNGNLYRSDEFSFEIRKEFFNYLPTITR